MCILVGAQFGLLPVQRLLQCDQLNIRPAQQNGKVHANLQITNSTHQLRVSWEKRWMLDLFAEGIFLLGHSGRSSG